MLKAVVFVPGKHVPGIFIGGVFVNIVLWREYYTLSGTPRHGTDPWICRFMARHSTENLGTENLGTARHGKSWHGKIMARHGPEKYHTIIFWGEIILGRKLWT